MRESELHQHIFARSADLAAAFPGIIVGPGDDCAVVRVAPAHGGGRPVSGSVPGLAPPGSDLLLKVDQLVEHRHFLPTTPIDLIARKAIARTVSDIAAMAGTPMWGLASGVLPPGYAHADQLCERLAHWGRHWGAPLVGGDIATGPAGCPLSLSITVVGRPHEKRGPVLRSGARPGDEVWVTGPIGNSLANRKHLTFEPRLKEARLLADALGANLHAMMDISDGLGRDGGRLASASKVRIVIEADRIPLASGATDALKAAADGEDYELLFTSAPLAMAGLVRANPKFQLIGRVEQGTGCVIRTPDGTPHDAVQMGWDH